MTIEDLPAYIHGDCCRNRHFLTLNRDIQGRWTIGYTEYENGSSMASLSLNGSETIQQAAERMAVALERYNKWHKKPFPGSPAA